MFTKTSFLLRRRSSATLKTPVLVKAWKTCTERAFSRCLRQILPIGKSYLSESPVDFELPLSGGGPFGRRSMRTDDQMVSKESIALSLIGLPYFVLLAAKPFHLTVHNSRCYYHVRLYHQPAHD